jgi:hypothetical protein
MALEVTGYAGLLVDQFEAIAAGVFDHVVVMTVVDDVHGTLHATAWEAPGRSHSRYGARGATFKRWARLVHPFFSNFHACHRPLRPLS